jgi:AcrR family transcriptional regulator
MPPTSPRPSRSPLTRDRVFRAAVRLADRQGLEALSMRRLATALKVEAMSLYNHVANKDDLLDGMVELAVGEIVLPAAGLAWKDALRQRATAAHEVMLQHPWLPLLMSSRMNIGPNMLGYIESVLRTAREAGFTWADTDQLWNAIDSYVVGFTLQVVNYPVDPAEYASAAAAYLPMLDATRFPYMREITAQVADGTHDGTHDFAFGLELLLEGLERRLGGTAPPSRAARAAGSPR